MRLDAWTSKSNDRGLHWKAVVISLKIRSSVGVERRYRCYIMSACGCIYYITLLIYIITLQAPDVIVYFDFGYSVILIIIYQWLLTWGLPKWAVIVRQVLQLFLLEYFRISNQKVSTVPETYLSQSANTVVICFFSTVLSYCDS